MTEWKDFLDLLLKHNNSFDNLFLSSTDDNIPVCIPPIVKASVLMLDRMVARKGKRNVFVFPEKSQTVFVFTLVKLLHNIAEGKIRSLYNPEAFVPGEKLKYGNYVVEFLGLENKDGVPCIAYRTADWKAVYAPVDGLRMFQRTNTNRRLSNYSREMAPAPMAQNSHIRSNPGLNLLNWLEDYRTHMESSVFYLTPLASTRENLTKWKLCGKSISDLLLIGQADYDGNVRNINSGQLSGIPAIVLASDLYSIVQAAEKQKPMQSVILDISNTNSIMSQMDAFDKVLSLDIPVVCLTSIADSTGLQPLLSRNFSVWRWDGASIVGSLFNASPLVSDRKIKHCVNHHVDYIAINDQDICTAARCLLNHRNEVQEQSPRMMKVFEKLKTLVFGALRETIPMSASDSEYSQKTLWDCLEDLSAEKGFLDSRTYSDYESVIESMMLVTTHGYRFQKQSALEEYLVRHGFSEICIVVSNYEEKLQLMDFWQHWCVNAGLPTKVHVLNQNEYLTADCTTSPVTIVVGWLNRTTMQRILYSFNTQRYAVLLYDCECGWKNSSTAYWKRELGNSGNIPIIQSAFDESSVKVSTSNYSAEEPIAPAGIAQSADELDEVELILRENKFRQFAKDNTDRPTNDTAEAVPVSFVGGYLSFYRTAHRIISATRIIVQDADSIDNIYPLALRVGDFVVVREADRDIIREMADTILKNSWKGHLRALSGKWKEALEIERLFHTPEEIFEKLVAAGCTKGYQTVRGWILSDDTIAPSSKEDLKFIADITGNEVMLELLNQIHEAAHEVRNAHTQAGMILSQKLRARIASALDQYGQIDPFNIYEPIELNLEDIGMVKVLKVIDIGSVIVVDMADTNRLIEE